MEKYLYNLLWHVRREFLKMIHVTDQEVKDVWGHQGYSLIGVLGDGIKLFKQNLKWTEKN